MEVFGAIFFEVGMVVETDFVFLDFVEAIHVELNDGEGTCLTKEDIFLWR